MNIIRLIIPFCFSLIRFYHALLSDDWNTISVCTIPQKFHDLNQTSSEFELQCVHPGDRLVIGWSHYGVSSKSSNFKDVQSSNCMSSSNDCLMQHTDKVAELCTGHERCIMSTQPQFVHRCSQYSTYLYIIYKCVPTESTESVCSSTNIISDDLYITSPNFPFEYIPSQKASTCTCELTSSQDSNLIVDSMMTTTSAGSINVQSKQHQKSFNSLAIGNMLVHNPVNKLRITLQSSDQGFLLSAKAVHKCPDGLSGITSMCLNTVSQQTNHFDAMKKCQNKMLPWPDDVSDERRLIDWLFESASPSVAVPNDKFFIKQGKCLVYSTTKGFATQSCNRNATAVCAIKRKDKQYPISMQCNVNHIHAKLNPSVSTKEDLMSSPISNINYSEQIKHLRRIQECLFWLLCTCIGLVTINLIICLSCYRKTFLIPLENAKNFLFAKKPIKSRPQRNPSCNYCTQCLSTMSQKRCNRDHTFTQEYNRHHIYDVVVRNDVVNQSAGEYRSVGKNHCLCLCHHHQPSTEPPLNKTTRIILTEMLSNSGSTESGYSSHNRILMQQHQNNTNTH